LLTVAERARNRVATAALLSPSASSQLDTRAFPRFGFVGLRPPLMVFADQIDTDVILALFGCFFPCGWCLRLRACILRSHWQKSGFSQKRTSSGQ
jgi:hypothetical protein